MIRPEGGGVWIPWGQWEEIRSLALNIMAEANKLPPSVGKKRGTMALQALLGRFDTALGLPWTPQQRPRRKTDDGDPAA